MAERFPTDKPDWLCQRCLIWYSPEIYECTKCGTCQPYDLTASAYLYKEELIGEDETAPSTSRGTYQYDPDAQTFTPKTRRPSRPRHEDEGMDFPVKECRLVLLGKTGSGKSSTGNTILGSMQFDVGCGSKSKTFKSWWKYAKRFGITIEIVDTPGMFDTNIDDATVSKEIVKSVGCVTPGPHALLFVIRADVRFTQEEASVMTHIRSMFGDGITRHVIIVFTHGDDFESYKDFQCDFIQDLQPDLASVLQAAGYRYVLFNNKERNPRKNEEQVRKLLVTVRRMLAHTDDRPFENPMFLRCHETVLASTDELARNLGNALPTEASRNLLLAAFAGKRNAEKLLHKVLDCGETAMADYLKEVNDKLMVIVEQSDLALADLQEQQKELLEKLEAEKEKLEAEKEKLEKLEAEKEKLEAEKEKLEAEKKKNKRKTKSCVIL